MALKKYTDAAGNVYELDDEKSLIEGHPDLKQKAPESTNDPKFTPVRAFHPPRTKPEKDWRKQKAAPPAGYDNPVDDPEYLKKIQFNPKEKP